MPKTLTQKFVSPAFSLQVAPDWSRRARPEEFRTQFCDLTFKGPGWYYNGSDTILIIPDIDPATVTAGEGGNWTDLWKQKWPKDTIFWVHCWNVLHHSNLFNALINAPTREA